MLVQVATTKFATLFFKNVYIGKLTTASVVITQAVV